MRKYAAVLIILVSLTVPFAGAAVPDDTRQTGPVITGPELNKTGVDFKNHSIPSRYMIPPTLIHVKVEISDTSLPGPKGEMAAGPRTIGFSAEPISLTILVVAIIAIVVGVWYVVKRKREEDVGDKNGENQE